MAEAADGLYALAADLGVATVPTYDTSAWAGYLDGAIRSGERAAAEVPGLLQLVRRCIG